MREESKSVILSEVVEYLDNLPEKHKERVDDVMRLLDEHGGMLGYPYSSYLGGKIRELRIGLGRLEHRVLYALLPGGEILLITAFLKKTPKTPKTMIDGARRILEAYLKIKNK